MMPDGVEVDLDELLEKANHMKRAMGEARKVPQVNPDCSVKKVNMEGVRNVSMRFSRYYRVCLFLIRHCKRVTNSQYISYQNVQQSGAWCSFCVFINLCIFPQQLPMDCVKETAFCKQVKYLRVDCHGLREPKDNHPCIVTCGSSKKDERV